MISAGTRDGWMVVYAFEIPWKNHRTGEMTTRKQMHSYESISREDVVQRKDEVKKAGAEIVHFCRCIF